MSEKSKCQIPGYSPSPSPFPSDMEPPNLVHSWDSNDSIISSFIASKRQLLICGTQNGKILIFELKSYRLVNSICEEEMQGSNLCLDLSPDENLILTGGSDSLIKVYDITNLENPHCVKIIYSSVDIGDIFSIYYCNDLGVLFIGAQNASLLWCTIDLKGVASRTDSTREVLSRDNLPHLRYNKFFDSKGPSGTLNTRRKKLGSLDSISLCEINPNDCIKFAHFGYIYSLTLYSNEFIKLKYPEHHKILVSCGGDGLIHLWGVNKSEKGGITLTKIKTLKNEDSILSMQLQNTYIYVGLSNGCINVWDLLTSQLIKTFKSRDNKEISCLAVLECNTVIYGNKCGLNLIFPNGKTQAIDSKSTLTLYLSEENNVQHLICGGENSISYYQTTTQHHLAPKTFQSLGTDNESLVKNLEKFISFRTISKFNDFYLHDLRNCTKYLIKLLDEFGATSNLIPIEGGNPIIISTFKKNTTPSETEKDLRLLYYGHYDVVDAIEDLDNWATNPFEMVRKNGFLYGRGVSDNKGPTLAVIQSVAEIYAKKQLGVDVVFIIEGEEENGSKHFKSHITKHLDLIGDIDYIFLSNSYWLDDERPCLNYGLRGVINCSIEIESDKPDRHSGVDGGVSKEPTMDMINLLSTLTSTNDQDEVINIKGFYDNVHELDTKELENFNKIISYNPKFNFEELVKRWTQPSLTIHKIEVSGPNNDTVIPKLVKCSLSIRIVPNQDIEHIKKSLIDHLTERFNTLKTPNRLNLDIFHEVEPWLGDYSEMIYKLVYSKIAANWGVEPLLIREGGSIPSIRFLEKILDAKACQIPCGQASDNAHLKNERLRIANLFKLKDTFKDILIELPLRNTRTYSDI